MTFERTVPYCGQCGWEVENSGLGDIGDDLVCDSCGADLALYGFALLIPPTDLGAVGGSLQVTFTWTEDASIVYDFQHQTDGGAFTLVSPATSPQVIVGTAGQVIGGQVRAVVDGVAGPWSTIQSDTVLA